MNILFDENMPRRLKRFLPTHTVSTTQEMGWASISNGRLLDLAESLGFDVLLTRDRNLEHQQNLEGRSIAVIVMLSVNNRFQSLVPLVPAVEAFLPTVAPGKVYSVSADGETT